jgi:transposase-like protein
MLESNGLEVVADGSGAGRSAEGAVGDRSRVGGRVRVGVPDPELVDRPRRRRFAAEYKLRIVREADACSRPGEVGELLRREGLYSSLLTEWRRARDSGALEALAPRRRGPAGQRPELVELAAVRRRLERSEADLKTARRVIEIQGNVSALLEQMLGTEGASEHGSIGR